MAGFQTSGWDYKQHALICTVDLDTKNQTTWQRFLPTGPLALLPMGKKFSNIARSTTPEQAAQLKGMTRNKFVQQVNSTLQHDCRPHLLSQISRVLDSTPLISETFQIPPKVCSTDLKVLNFVSFIQFSLSPSLH
ncbi:hypothetical protein SUGI_0081540 [Cryptomeria japonica]|nr:hypothetical protein SUGI_0081540 [Cryptomeria japonica]